MLLLCGSTTDLVRAGRCVVILRPARLRGLWLRLLLDFVTLEGRLKYVLMLEGYDSLCGGRVAILLSYG